MTRSIFLSLLLAATFSSMTHAEPASQPASQPATRPAGKWHWWSACMHSSLRGSGPGSLWFGGLGGLWRYDLKTQRIQAFSPLDGLALAKNGIGRVTVASDERCAFFIEHYSLTYLWHPEDGWRALPPVSDGARVYDIAFDAADRLLCLVYQRRNGYGIYRLDKGDKWKHLIKTPCCRAFIPLEKGYVLLGSDKRKEKLKYLPADKPEAVMNLPYSKPFNEHFRYFRMGKKVYGFIYARSAFRRGEIGGYPAVYEITPKGFIEHQKGEFIGLDLLKKGFLRARRVESSGKHPVFQIDGIDGLQIKLTDESPFMFPFRDANGHVWLGNSRWDGKSWRKFVPPWYFDFPVNSYVRDPKRAFLDTSTMSWRRLAPLSLNTHNPANRIARIAGASKRGEVLDKFAFKFGPWTLSMLPSDRRYSSSMLFTKIDGKWESFSGPFGRTAWGCRNMIHGDRMLINCDGVGTLEYDATNDRWACLLRGRGFRPGFDSKGRRIFHNIFGILMYDGDPFLMNGKGAADKDADKNAALFSELLKLMDNNEWQVRENATLEMKKMTKTMRRRLEAAMRRTNLSLEVRVRIKHILKEAGPGTLPPLPPSLFRQMHPLLKPVK